MDTPQYQGAANMSNEEFNRMVNDIGSNILKMSQNVSSMSKLVNQLQTMQDSQPLRNQLIQIQTYTQRLAKDTSQMIMELMKMPLGDDPMSKLKRDRLSDDYMASLNAFQAVQRRAAQKNKDDIRKVKEQNVHITDPFSIGGGNNQAVEMDNRQQLQTEKAMRDLEEREKEMRSLESDILDVNQIFKELGTLVHEQGAVVESIESNVELTAHSVEAGTQELRHAANYKNKLRKKKVYIGIFVTVILLIILISVFSR